MSENSSFLRVLVESGAGYLWFILLAAWGGTVSYLSRLRKSKTPFSFIELVGEWTISAFAGIVTAYICAEMGMSFYLTAALVAISGHMGGRAIFLLENWAQRKLQLPGE